MRHLSWTARPGATDRERPAVPALALRPMGGPRARSRAFVSACALTLLVLAGCGGRSPGASAQPPGPATTGVGDSSGPTHDQPSSSAPSSSSPPGDDHAVERPGPFRAPLHSADI